MTLLALEGRPQPLKVKKANFSENRNAINHTKTSEHKQSVKRLWNISDCLWYYVSLEINAKVAPKWSLLYTERVCVCMGCSWAAVCPLSWHCVSSLPFISTSLLLPPLPFFLPVTCCTVSLNFKPIELHSTAPFVLRHFIISFYMWDCERVFCRMFGS